MGEVLSFKCPCCTAALTYSGGTGELTCEYCGASFTVEQAQAAQAAEAADAASSDMTWTTAAPSVIRDEDGKVSGYVCSSCGAEMVADESTAATECPYCGNNAIIHQSFDGLFRPDVVIPFAVDKAAAQEALRAFYHGKKLLPKSFTETSRLENITGLYVPFWLMSCHAEGYGEFEGTRSRHWEDAQFVYMRRDFYRAVRHAEMDFDRIPADASTQMDDATMDSLEPYDLAQAKPYDAAYFSGYLADRYDVDAAAAQPRATERVENTFMQHVEAAAARDYETVSLKNRALRLTDTKTEYAMLPVWMLSTKYEDKVYSFAMNGQSGKVAGSLPVDKGKYYKYFVLAAVIALAVMQLAVFFLAQNHLAVGELVALGAALLVGLLYAQALKSGMNNVSQQWTAGSYLRDGSVRITPSDLFLYSKTDRMPKSQPQNAQNAAPMTAGTPRPGQQPAFRPQGTPVRPQTGTRPIRRPAQTPTRPAPNGQNRPGPGR